jgi:hypothetical protein
VPIDSPKDKPLTHCRSREPTAQRADRTGCFFSSKRDGDARASALTIGLRASDRQHDPLRLEAQVSYFERDELAAA